MKFTTPKLVTLVSPVTPADPAPMLFKATLAPEAVREDKAV